MLSGVKTGGLRAGPSPSTEASGMEEPRGGGRPAARWALGTFGAV